MCAPDDLVGAGLHPREVGDAERAHACEVAALELAVSAATAAASVVGASSAARWRAIDVAPGIAAPKNSSTFLATISRSLSTQIMW